jgi:hypothetical protein
MKKASLIAAVIAAFSIVTLAAVLSGTPFCEATPLPGGWYKLVSDASPGYGGIDYNTPASFKFTDINVLRAQQQPEADDTCTGGSPRFQLNVDTDGDGDQDGNVFVHTQFAPGGCPGDTGDLAEVGGNGEVVGTYDLSQIGGSGYTNYSGALAFFAANPTYRITGIQYIVDSGWAFADGEQTITARPVVDVTLSPPGSAAACRNGGWQTTVRADGTPFRNQGDCIQYVNTGR